jgi:hypothetical protein
LRWYQPIGRESRARCSSPPQPGLCSGGRIRPPRDAEQIESDNRRRGEIRHPALKPISVQNDAHDSNRTKGAPFLADFARSGDFDLGTTPPFHNSQIRILSLVAGPDPIGYPLLPTLVCGPRNS